MRHTTPRRLAGVAAPVLALILLAGCGEDEPSDTGSGSTGQSAEQPETDTDIGDSGDDAPAPAFCDVLTAEQVGEAVGAPVTLATGPFDACEFDQEDLRALSGALGTVAVDVGNGGYEAYRSGSLGTLDNAEEHTLDGLGDEAFVATGTFAGGENLQASGGALVGGQVYTVTLIQGSGTSADELVTVTEALLGLMLDA